MRKILLIISLAIAVFIFSSVNNSSKPIAIVYDPLSSELEQTPFFEILTTAGYDVTTYTDDDATVNSFKSIPSEASLILLRVHSTINNGKVWVFTGEAYSNEKHSIDQLFNNVHKARTQPEGAYLFALGSGVFFDYIPELDGTEILVLGCDAAASDDMADVYLGKGASAFISWDGPVSLEHTDAIFGKILEQMTLGVSAETAAEIALDEIGCDPYFKSRLVCFKQ